MDDGYLGEIRLFAGNFSPIKWAYCSGQLIAISANTALFSLLGTAYGGDGRSTFALPDLRGRIPIGAGRGPGLSNRELGERGGNESVQLAASNLPSHTHGLMASPEVGNEVSPQDAVSAISLGTVKLGRDNYTAQNNNYSESLSNPVQMIESVVSEVGGEENHTNVQPYSALHYIICTSGLYPPRL